MSPHIPIQKAQRLLQKVSLRAQELVGSTTGVWKNPAAKAPKSRTDIKVETYNVHSGKTADGKRANLETIAAQIRNSKAGVVALQELEHGDPGRAWARELAELTGMNLAWAEGQQKAVLSKYPIQSVKRIDFPESAQNQTSHETRGLLAVSLNVGGRKVDVATAHLDIPMSQPDNTGPNAAQIREVRKFIEARKKEGVPVIVAGDFNSNFAIPAGARTTDGWLNSYRGPGRTEELGTVRDPRVRREAQELLRATTDHWEAPSRTVILSDGTKVTPDEARSLLRTASPKNRKRYEELLDAADGVSHPGADKRFDNLFASGLKVVASVIDYSAAGSDHKPVSAVFRLPTK